MEKTWKILESFGVSIAFAGIGIILGAMGGFWWVSTNVSRNSLQSPSIATQQKASIVSLLSIENGILTGTVEGGEVRVIVNAANAISAENGNFSIDIVEILPMLKSIPAPDGMLFVASKSGKKYYPLDSPSAFGLAVKNRIFFATEEEAKATGRTKGK